MKKNFWNRKNSSWKGQERVQTEKDKETPSRRILGSRFFHVSFYNIYIITERYYKDIFLFSK